MKFFSYICNCVALDTGMCAFDSSEVSFHSSEEFFIPHVGISKYLGGNHFSPTWCRFDM